MNKYMTIDEHDRFVELEDKFDSCVSQCGKEIAVMQHKYEMKGWYVNDYELREKDIYLVWFENSHDDETVTINVPILYMCDELFRKNYSTYLNDQRAKKEEERKVREQKIKDENIKNQEIHERSEYERLKMKFENSGV